METLLHSLLEYFSVGSRGEEYRPTDTREVVDDVIEGLSTSLVEAGAEIVRSGLPVVTADGTQLRQVFHNLIDNAVKFRGEEPLRIEVSAECHDHVWAFSVQDNGIGIEPEYHDQIFGIFKRLHGGGQYPGTGAGLALCMRIIERHRGRMWVDSGPGAGSCFCFSLPA